MLTSGDKSLFRKVPATQVLKIKKARGEGLELNVRGQQELDVTLDSH